MTVCLKKKQHDDILEPLWWEYAAIVAYPVKEKKIHPKTKGRFCIDFRIVINIIGYSIHTLTLMPNADMNSIFQIMK